MYKFIKKGLECTAPTDVEDMSPFLQDPLGQPHFHRFYVLGKEADLQESTELISKALQATNSGGSMYAARLLRLTSFKFEHIRRNPGPRPSFDEIIEAFRKAVRCTNPSNPELPKYLMNLGTVLLALTRFHYWDQRRMSLRQYLLIPKLIV